jgi:hypothetical protein
MIGLNHRDASRRFGHRRLHVVILGKRETLQYIQIPKLLNAAIRE